MLKKVHTDKAPQAIGPYSQAVICGNMLYTSGQIAINPASGEVEATDIEGQTQQVMDNLAAVLGKIKSEEVWTCPTKNPTAFTSALNTADKSVSFRMPQILTFIKTCSF